MGDAPAGDAEISRLRAFVARVSPILVSALQLRELGRSIESVEKSMNERRSLDYGTRSATPLLMLHQAYETALQDFDKRVKDAALGDFADLIGPTWSI